ncbi:hypothetical protein [Arthrobacter sp. H14]|uniref:hypothetical protein n=1 Tax=Arthrobacter sp. H14 TaxID=1312959 RepID=UPI00047D9309|nr:hypothetical protein [Arthrobacter sp. H14]
MGDGLSGIDEAASIIDLTVGKLLPASAQIFAHGPSFRDGIGASVSDGRDTDLREQEQAQCSLALSRSESPMAVSTYTYESLPPDLEGRVISGY